MFYKNNSLLKILANYTDVLVLGSIHSSHTKNPNCSYENVIHILDAYQPDALCVDIRPVDFRKNSEKNY